MEIRLHNKAERTMRCLHDSVAELSFTLDESAFIVLNTSASFPVLVSMLNRLYRWHLTMLRTVHFQYRDFGGNRDSYCPVFMHSNTLSHCAYILICDPAMGYDMGQALDGYNAMLIIAGVDAFRQQMGIFDDFTDSSERRCDDGDLRSRNREELRRLIKNELIVSCDYMSFQHCEGSSKSVEQQITNFSVTSVSPKSKVLYTKAGNVEVYNKEKKNNAYRHSLNLFDPVPDYALQPVHRHFSQPKTSILSLEELEGKRHQAGLRRLRELQEASSHILNVLYGKFLI